MNGGFDQVVASVRPHYEYHLVEVTEHVWCDHCALPSALSMRYVLVHRLNPMVWQGAMIMTACRECGSTNYTS